MGRIIATFVIVLTLPVAAGADDDWFEARSDHFTIVSDGSEGRAKDTLEDLEQLRRLITQIFPSQRVDSTKPAVFYLFRNEKSMRPFQPTRDGKREEWAGMFRPMPLRDAVLVLANGKPDSVRGLAFSQYTYLLGSYNDENYPVWLSNGLASFYANTDISDKRAHIGEMRDEYRRTLGQFRSVPIRELFAVDRSSDYYRDSSKRRLFDAQTWALVHYLLIGQLQNNGPIRLGHYVSLVAQGRDSLLAFQEAMGRPFDEIDHDVAVYIRKSITQYLKVNLPPLEMDEEFRIRKLDTVDASAHLGELYVAARYAAAAEQALAQSIEAKPDQVLAYEVMASLRERQGKRGDAAAFYDRAVRNGSTNPHVRLRQAQRFVNAGNVSERSSEDRAVVLQSLRLVLEEAPELTDAARLFGFLSLHDADTRADGHRVIAKALEQNPGNPNLVFMLGQLHSRDGNYAAARVIFQQLLERELAPSFNASVRRQYDYVDARLKQEAQRAAAAAARAGGAPPSPAETEADASSSSVDPAGPAERAGVELVGDDGTLLEIRGTLVRFDCTDGHRFVVEADGLSYVLEIVNLELVEILENGQNAGTREFYCGTLDSPVIARFTPTASGERTGRLVAIEFVDP